MGRAEALAVLLALADPPTAPAGPCPPLAELLDRAGRYVLAVEQQLTALVGNESYSQLRFLGRQGAPLETRKLESEVAWVATGDPMVWAFSTPAGGAHTSRSTW